MEYNKILRRHGYPNQYAYDRLSDDFIELFDGYNGVSSVKTTAGVDQALETETRIYLDSAHSFYLRIKPDENAGVRISIHSGTSSFYVDQHGSENEFVSYNIVKTQYGVAFTTLPYVYDNHTIISDGYFQCFFTTFRTEDGDPVNGFVYCCHAKNETNVSYTSSSYIITELHDDFEEMIFSRLFLGDTACQTVMFNLVSFTKPLICPYLYKKVMSENSKFGMVHIGNRTFISGSHLNLLCGANS